MSSAASTNYQTSSAMDSRTPTPDARPLSHSDASGLEERQHPGTSIDDNILPGQQAPAACRADCPASTALPRVGDTAPANEDARFQEAVTVGEHLKGELEMFLLLLEGVPQQFRSHRYYHMKTEFLKVKGTLSETVNALRAPPYKDMRMIAHQYQQFKDTIYDNLYALLTWLNTELGRCSETQQTGFGGSSAESDPQISTCSQLELQPDLVNQPAHVTESSSLGKLILGPDEQSSRCSSPTEVASPPASIPHSPLEVEIPPHIEGAANFVIEDGVVKCASLSALIVILTSPKPNPDIKDFEKLQDAVLLSFRCFIKPVDFAKILIARFHQGQPDRLTKDQEGVLPPHAQAIRLRVLNVLQSWVEFHWVHEDDRPAVPLIRYFVESTIGPRWRGEGGRIREGLEGHLQEFNHTDSPYNTQRPEMGTRMKLLRRRGRRGTLRLLPTYAPMSECSRSSSGEDILKSATIVTDLVRSDRDGHILMFNSDQRCAELARQLTLLMSTEFRSLDPETLWHHFRRQCDDCHTTRAIKVLQKRLLALQMWTVKSVLVQNDPEMRASVMTLFIALAFRCRKLRNYGALCAIYSGLTLGFTEKLSQANLPLPDATKSALQDLHELVQKARNDHESSVSSSKPTVPLITWYFEDFNAVDEEQDQVILPGTLTEVLNVDKYCTAARIVRNMEKCHTPYETAIRARAIQDWISKKILDISEQNLGEMRGWVDSRCDAIERNISPRPKSLFRNLSKPFMKKETIVLWTRAEITDLIPELLSSGSGRGTEGRMQRFVKMT